MNSFYWLEMFPWFLKEDMSGGRGHIGDWGVTITHIYSTKARVKSG
jgi:hypothetical protein